jgi:atypical dual specificity phosphatase
MDEKMINTLGLTMLETKLHPDHRSVFRRRNRKSELILYGADAKTQELLCSYLADLLHDENPRYTIYLLQGGMKEFVQQYPFFCNTANIRDSFLRTRRLYPTKICENLYLGGIREAMCRENLKRVNTTHVVNITKTGESPFFEDFEYLNFGVSDHELSDLRSFFETAFDYIDAALESKHGQSVLVHCRYGTSRSSTIVIAYLMKRFSWTLQQSYEYVRDRRPTVLPNYGFWGQLANYEYQLHGKSTLKHAVNIRALFPDRPAIKIKNMDRCVIL